MWHRQCSCSELVELGDIVLQHRSQEHPCPCCASGVRLLLARTGPGGFRNCSATNELSSCMHRWRIAQSDDCMPQKRKGAANMGRSHLTYNLSREYRYGLSDRIGKRETTQCARLSKQMSARRVGYAPTTRIIVMIMCCMQPSGRLTWPLQ